jgi:hypothetical protein
VSEFVSDVLLGEAASADAETPAISRLEFLPGWLVYGPVIAQWLALGAWHRDLSLPTAANPLISTGGLCGERKSAILDLTGPAARRWVAPWTTLVTGHNDVSRASRAMLDAGVALPVVVKPDIGCNGTGVRLVRDVAALAEALAAFPRDVTLVLQAFVDLPGEAGIFYIRHPDEVTGRITSLTLKRPPSVVGDGVSTVRALINADPRHRRLLGLYGARLGARLAEIPAAGARVQLVFAGNHCKGSIFTDGAEEITAALTARMDAIAKDIPQFYFGRLDVRFGSLAALRRGEDFSIIEINGVGSEATHIWDPATRLSAIWADQLRHYGAAWTIAAALRKRGTRPSGLRAMWRDWRAQIRLMASYPVND